MPGITPQAQRLANVLSGFGLRHRRGPRGEWADFFVRTDSYRCRDRETGVTWREYSSAWAGFYSAAARARVVDSAEAIAKALDGTVRIYQLADGTVYNVVVSTDWAQGGWVEVDRMEPSPAQPTR